MNNLDKPEESTQNNTRVLSISRSLVRVLLVVVVLGLLGYLFIALFNSVSGVSAPLSYWCVLTACLAMLYYVLTAFFFKLKSR